MHRNKEKKKINSDQIRGWTTQELIPGRGKIFSLFRNVQTSLGPIQPLIDWVLGVPFSKETGT